MCMAYTEPQVPGGDLGLTKVEIITVLSEILYQKIHKDLLKIIADF
jgi:hypothetical protein